MKSLPWSYLDLYLCHFLVLAGRALVLLLLVVSYSWQTHLYHFILHLHPHLSLFLLACLDAALHHRVWLIVPRVLLAEFASFLTV